MYLAQHKQDIVMAVGSRLADLNTSSYPSPLSPPLCALSKQVELRRAIAASSRSNIFSLTADDVLFHDEWLIAVNKPQGVYCDTLLSAIPHLLQSLLGTSVNHGELHLANRLDRDTTGVSLITKSHKAAAKLVKAFTEHQVAKSYIARCTGSAENLGRMVIRSGHGRSKFGAWRVYAASDAGRALPGGSVVKEMETKLEVLSVNGELRSKAEGSSEENLLVVEEASVVSDVEGDDEILIRAFPRSGRTHQIRLHCQYVGIPIIGDVKYGGVRSWSGKLCEGHELHAESISFHHPITGIHLAVSAPLPPWVGYQCL